MFPIKNNLIQHSYWKIVEDYEDLWFDETPIIFTGKNCMGRRILGSSVCESKKMKTERFFHLLLEDHEYKKFILGKISYRELLLLKKGLYVVDVSFDGKNIVVNGCDPSDIPEEFLPTKNSFYPQQNDEKID